MGCDFPRPKCFPLCRQYSKDALQKCCGRRYASDVVPIPPGPVEPSSSKVQGAWRRWGAALARPVLCHSSLRGPRLHRSPASTMTMGTRVSTSMPAKDPAQERPGLHGVGLAGEVPPSYLRPVDTCLQCRSCTCESITNRSFAEHRVSKQGG